MKRLGKLIKPLLISLLAVLLSVTTLVTNPNEIKAEGPYRVEVIRGFGRKIGGEKATLVFGDPVDTGYSYYGSFPGGAVDQSGDASTKRYSQSTVSGAQVTGVDIYYGDHEKYSTSSTGVYFDGSTFSNTGDAANQLLALSFSATSFFCRFVNINDNLTIVLRYQNGEKQVTFNNVASIQYGSETLTNNVLYNYANNIATLKVATKAATATYSTHPVFGVTPLSGVVESIDVVYANKYYTTITSEMLTGTYYFTKNTSVSPNALDPNEGTPSSVTSNIPLLYSNGSFTFVEVANVYSITYNYEAEKHTVNFYANDTLYDSKQVNDGNTVAKLTTDPTKTSYNFTAWYQEEGLNNIYDFSTPVTADLDLYAGFGHTLSVYGAITTESLDGTTYWPTATGGTTFANEDGALRAHTLNDFETDVTGDYLDIGANFNITYADVEAVQITYNGHSTLIEKDYLIDGASFTGFLDSDGVFHDSIEPLTSGKYYILKVVHNSFASQANYLFFRAYNMYSDLDINILGKHVVTFKNFGHRYYSSNGNWLQGNYISASTWASNTGGVLYSSPKAAMDEFGNEYNQAMGTVIGNYDNNTGMAANFYTILEDLTAIRFKYGDREAIELDCTSIKGAGSYFIDANYQLAHRETKLVGDLFKLAVSSTSTNTINARFYRIVENIEIEAIYNNQHTITFTNYDTEIEAGAYSPANSGTYVGINCFDPYGSSYGTRTGLRNAAILDGANGIATVYGNYKQENGIGACINVPTDFDTYKALLISFDSKLYRYELDNSRSNSITIKDGNDENLFKINVEKDADYYSVRFFKIERDYTFDAKAQSTSDHIVAYVNASKVTSPEWTSEVGGDSFAISSNNTFIATTNGDYTNTSYTSSDGIETLFYKGIGEIDEILFSFNNDKSFRLTGNEFTNSFTYYVDENGNRHADNSANATYVFAVSYSLLNPDYFTIRLFNITDDFTVNASYTIYCDVNFIYNDQNISSQRILQGNYVIVPEDPASEEGKEFIWYEDELLTKPFNANGRIYESVDLYGALVANVHHVTFSGLGFQYRSVSNPPAYLSSSTWVSKTHGYVDTQEGHLTTIGDYSDSTGVEVVGRTSNYYVNKVEFKVGNHEPVYLSSKSGDSNYFVTTVESGDYWYLNSGYVLEKRASKQAGDILRFRVTSKSDTGVDVVFYEINDDIQITMMYQLSQRLVINGDGTFDLNVYTYVPKTVRTDGAYAMLAGKKVMFDEMTYVDYGVGDRLYALTISDIAPKQIADTLSVQFFDGQDKSLTDNKNLSVMAYLNAIKGTSYACSEELKDLAKALLNYGAECQLAFNYNTENLANAELTPAEKDLSGVTSEVLAPYAMTSSGSTDGVMALGETLSLNKNTTFRVFFEITNDIADYTFMDGSSVLTPVYAGLYNSKPMYYVTIGNVAAPDLMDMHHISIKYNNTGDYVINVNVLTYVGLSINNPDAYTNVAKALYKLAEKASVFKNTVYSVSTIFDTYLPADGNKLKIAFIGDSITFGYGSTNPAENSYPAVLDELFGNKYNIGNFAMSGSYVLDPYTYSDCSSYIDQTTGNFISGAEAKYYPNTIQYQNSKDFEPDIVIIMQGTNDQRSIAKYGSDARTAYKESLARLVEEYQSLPTVKRVYVMTSICVHPDDEKESTTGLSYNDVADGILCDLQIAVSNEVANCGLIDLHHMSYQTFGNNTPSWALYFCGDHLHPNDSGYRYIAETLFDYLTNDTKYLSYVSFDDIDKELSKDVFYTNQTLEWGADPTIIYISDTNSSEYGYYYMYATSGYIGTSGIEAWRSKNLTDWECMGAAFLPDLDNDWCKGEFWAPSVVYNETSGLYYLFYSSPMNTREYTTNVHGEEIYGAPKTKSYRYDSYATSTNPYGPFENVDYKYEPMLKFEDHVAEITEPYYVSEYLQFENANGDIGYMKAIGPKVFIDDDGQTYFFFCADLDPDYCIAPDNSSAYCLRLDLVGNKYVPDYSSLTRITKYGKLWPTAEGDTEGNVVEDGKTNEGPVCFKYNGKYYLSFLTSTYVNPRYNTRLAVSDNVMGPYTKVAPYNAGVIAKTDTTMNRTCVGIRDIIKVPGNEGANDRYYAAYMTFWNDKSYGGADGISVRKFAVDELLPIDNDKGNTVFQLNGPSVTPQDLPEGISDYMNLAQLPSPLLTVSATNVINDADLLVDGLIPFGGKYPAYDEYKDWTRDQKLDTTRFSAKEECQVSAGTVTVTFDFANYVDLRAVMVYNSKDLEHRFDRVDSVDLYYKKNDETGVVTISPLKFNGIYDGYPRDESTTHGGAAIAEFGDIAVNKVVITLTPTNADYVGIPEIKLIGKKYVSSSVYYGTTGALYDNYIVNNEPFIPHDWKNVDSTLTIDAIKEDEYTNVVVSNSNYTVYSYKGSDGVYIYAEVSDSKVDTYQQVIKGSRYNVWENGHLTILLGEGSKTSLDKNVVGVVADVFNETLRYKGIASTNKWQRTWNNAATATRIKDDNSGFVVEYFVPYSQLGVSDASATIRMIVNKSSTSIGSTNPSIFTYIVQ